MINKNHEKTAKAWAWRALIGPANILDGIAQTVSLGYIAPGLCMRVCRHLMMARFEKKNEQK